MVKERVKHTFGVIGRSFPSPMPKGPSFHEEACQELDGIAMHYLPQSTSFADLEIFTIEAETAISAALDQSREEQKEIAVEGVIIQGTYKILGPIQGSASSVNIYHRTEPSPLNHYHPFEAFPFIFHTHPGNLFPSCMDVAGFGDPMLGQLGCAMIHKRTAVNPLFIIGRAEPQKQLLCYRFEKAFMPSPSTQGDAYRFTGEFYNGMYEVLKQKEGMTEDEALEKPLVFYVEVMNSLPGIKAFGHVPSEAQRRYPIETEVVDISKIERHD